MILLVKIMNWDLCAKYESKRDEKSIVYYSCSFCAFSETISKFGRMRAAEPYLGFCGDVIG